MSKRPPIDSGRFKDDPAVDTWLTLGGTLGRWAGFHTTERLDRGRRSGMCQIAATSPKIPGAPRHDVK